MTEPYQQIPESERSRAALVRALPLLIFTLCAVGAISIFALRNYFQFSDSAAMFDATAVVCGGQPAPATATYTNEAGIHPIVAFRLYNTGQLQVQNSYIPVEWLPQTAETAELVLCVGAERNAFRQLCSSGDLTEYGREVAVTLRAARTATIIQEGFISNIPNAPADCVDAPLDDGVDQEAAVTPAQVQAWLHPYVVR